MLLNVVAGPRVPDPLIRNLNFKLVAMEIAVAISIAMEIVTAISIATLSSDINGAGTRAIGRHLSDSHGTLS